MVALCGDRDKTGDSNKIPGQVDGSHVVVSTADMNRAIADVYVCRKDFFEAHKDLVTKFIYGYLKGCEEVTDLYKAHEDPQGPKAEKDRYQKVLELAQTIFGKETIPTLDDAHGLLSDCEFVNYNGNARFFTLGESNTIGFESLHKKSLDLALGQDYVTKRVPFAKTEFSYDSAPFTSLKKYVAPGKLGEIPIPIRPAASEGETVFTFSVFFEPDQDDFSPRVYGKHFKRAVEMANKFGACAVEIRGHADPTKVLLETIQAGEKLGILKTIRPGADSIEYTLNGSPLDLKDTHKLITLITAGTFEKASDEKGSPISPMQTLEATMKLSIRRAEQVKTSIIEFARSRGLLFSESQFAVSGAGITQPVVPVPKTEDEAQKNRHVEFRLVRIKAETSITAPTAPAPNGTNNK